VQAVAERRQALAGDREGVGVAIDADEGEAGEAGEEAIAGPSSSMVRSRFTGVWMSLSVISFRVPRGSLALIPIRADLTSGKKVRASSGWASLPAS
jgi:hypothetical protein